MGVETIHVVDGRRRPRLTTNAVQLKRVLSCFSNVSASNSVVAWSFSSLKLPTPRAQSRYKISFGREMFIRKKFGTAEASRSDRGCQTITPTRRPQTSPSCAQWDWAFVVVWFKRAWVPTRARRLSCEQCHSGRDATDLEDEFNQKDLRVLLGFRLRSMAIQRHVNGRHTHPIHSSQLGRLYRTDRRNRDKHHSGAGRARV